MVKFNFGFYKVFALALIIFFTADTFAQVPTISSFSPVSGARYSTIMITGTNFTGTTSVKFGEVPALYFFVNSPTSIQAIADTGASGNVSVTTEKGTAGKEGFTFIYPPRINSFSPVSGGINSVVTIHGSLFTGVTAVRFGALPALSFTVVSDTVITAVAGSGSSGFVSVTGPGGTGYLNGFTHLGPAISSYTPTAGPAGTVVTINGTNFTSATAVTFGGIPASSFTVVSANVITAVTAPGSAGIIAVSTPAGTGNIAGFNLPGLISFSPMSGTEGTEVNIKGKNFTGVNTVSFGSVAAASFSVLSDTTITAIVGLGASGRVKAGNMYGSDSLNFFNYNYPLPTLVSFTPLSGKEGDTITIKGAHLTGTNYVAFGNTQAKSFSVVSDTVINAVVGKGASGNINIYSSGGSAAIAGFVFNGPSISFFGPSSASPGDTVYIAGTNFNNVSAVSFGGTAASFFIAVSPVSIKAVVSTGSSGNIVVTTALGSAVAAGSFYMKPIVTSFTPTYVAPGDTVFIAGRYLGGAYYVSFGGTAATSFRVTSDTAIAAVAGSGSSGNISVITGGGTASLGGFAIIPIPRIDESGPYYGGTNTTLYVRGRYFTDATSVKIGGVEATSFTVVDEAHITAVVGAGATGNITVTTRGGVGTGAYFTFYEKPVITSFTPALAGPATEITIRGRNLNSRFYFDNGTTEHLSVKFGTQTALAATAVSDTVIIARVSGGSSGFVYVETPGGKDSMPGFNFKPLPTITSFSPASGPVGTTVTLRGTNFSPAAIDNTVYFGAVKATILSASANSITASVPAGATFEPISVTVNSLSAYTKKPFVVSYPGADNFSAHSYTSKTDMAVGFKPKAILGDMDADGKPDMVVSNTENNTVEIFSNRSTLDSISFAPKVVFTSCPKPVVQAVKDFDGDGKLDILLTGEEVNRPYIMLNNGTAGSLSFLPAILINAYARGVGLKVADFNSDGRPDITSVADYFTSVGSEFVGFLLNDFSDTVHQFTQQNTNVSDGNTDRSSYGAAITSYPTDLNSDGKPDLVVGLSLETVFFRHYFTILKNNSPAYSYYPFMNKINVTGSSLYTSYYPQAGDINEDSLPDMIADTIAYINTSNFTFTQQKNTCINCKFIDDMDGDGKQDLMTFNTDSIGIVRNKTVNGNVTFAPKVSFTTGGRASYYAIGDVNGDGKPDIVVSRYDDNTISILRNKVGEVFSLCPGGSTSVVSNISGTDYQWQQNKGSGFSNISDNATFSGTKSKTLSLNNVNDSCYGYKYRCIVGSNSSYTFTLQFENSWMGTVSSAWETAGNWACNTLPDGNTDVIINSGNVVLSSNGICRSIIVKSGATFTVRPGFQLTVTHNN